eukprot:1600088-Alexandrium_andersonii.AAC.1
MSSSEAAPGVSAAAFRASGRRGVVGGLPPDTPASGPGFNSATMALREVPRLWIILSVTLWRATRG